MNAHSKVVNYISFPFPKLCLAQVMHLQRLSGLRNSQRSRLRDHTAATYEILEVDRVPRWVLS